MNLCEVCKEALTNRKGILKEFVILIGKEGAIVKQ